MKDTKHSHKKKKVYYTVTDHAQHDGGNAAHDGVTFERAYTALFPNRNVENIVPPAVGIPYEGHATGHPVQVTMGVPLGQAQEQNAFADLPVRETHPQNTYYRYVPLRTDEDELRYFHPEAFH